MKGSFRLMRIKGIDIGVHYTWVLAFGLFAWLFADGLFPEVFPGWTSGTYWGVGVAASLLIFASVLLHELAHSLMAIARGMKVSGITLFIFGGVSNLEGEPEKPGIEFSMAVVGPLTSLVLGGILYGVYRAITNSTEPLPPIFVSAQTGQGETAIAGLIYYLGSINILLAIFNILPGFPLDGGRVLRSIIWGTTGSLVKATNIAATTGRIFGWLLIAWGVFMVLGGNWLNGIWIAFIGWFLNSAADSSRREVTMQEHLSGVLVKDVMDTSPECVIPAASIEEVVRQSFIQHGRRAVPVCQDEKLVGIVTLTDVKKLSQDRWVNVSVQEIMTRTPLLTVKPDDNLNSALKMLAQKSLNQVPVVVEGRLVGLLSRADVIRYLQMSQELGVKPKKPLQTPV
jgi:Zn-dependent protease/CBS domain-containing protein